MPRAKNRLTTRPRQTTRSSPLSHGNGAEGRVAIYPIVGSEYQNVSFIREFKSLIPPIFGVVLIFLKLRIGWTK